MATRPQTTAALIAALVAAFGAGTVTTWLTPARAFFGVSQIECEVKRPCPTNLEKFRFILAALPMARAVSVETGVPVSAIVAQTSLETGFGTSFLWREHRNGFGIKCSGSYTDCVSRWDHEYLNGVKTGWVSKFRTYSTGQGSFLDYAIFLRSNPRYAAAFRNRQDGVAFTREVARAGYATDPAYHSKLVKIITALDLHRFDLKPEQWKLSYSFCSPIDRGQGRCQ